MNAARSRHDGDQEMESIANIYIYIYTYICRLCGLRLIDWFSRQRDFYVAQSVDCCTFPRRLEISTAAHSSRCVGMRHDICPHQPCSSPMAPTSISALSPVE